MSDRCGKIGWSPERGYRCTLERGHGWHCNTGEQLTEAELREVQTRWLANRLVGQLLADAIDWATAGGDE